MRSKAELEAQALAALVQLNWGGVDGRAALDNASNSPGSYGADADVLGLLVAAQRHVDPTPVVDLDAERARRR